jgi:uncharacterized protein (TIGR00369 family)
MTTLEPLRTAVAVLAAQPFSHLVGARITELGQGTATLELDIDDRHRQQFGLVHGGVLAYLIDNALAFAAGSVLGSSVVSTGYSVNLVGNARSGTLQARGTVTHSDRGQAVCSVEITAVGDDGARTTCALAQGAAIRTLPRPSRSGAALPGRRTGAASRGERDDTRAHRTFRRLPRADEFRLRLSLHGWLIRALGCTIGENCGGLRTAPPRASATSAERSPLPGRRCSGGFSGSPRTRGRLCCLRHAQHHAPPRPRDRSRPTRVGATVPRRGAVRSSGAECHADRSRAQRIASSGSEEARTAEAAKRPPAARGRAVTKRTCPPRAPRRRRPARWQVRDEPTGRP